MVAEALERFHGELLDLVGRVTRLEVGTKSVTLNGLCQNNGRTSLSLQRFFVCSVDLLVVVTAAANSPDFVIGQVGNELLGFGVLAVEVLTDVTAVFTAEVLIVAVQSLVQQLDELTALVLSEKLVHLGAPDNLDDMPSSAAEESFEFLDDFPITTHGTVETLQVAVHYKGQVVEFFVSRELQCTA